MPIRPVSVPLYSQCTGAKNMSNQISRIRVTEKKPSQQEQTFFLQSFSLFLRASVFILRNEESMN